MQTRYLPEPFSNWTALILLGGAVGLLAACASRGASVEGQVFEAVNLEAPMIQWTRLPSADAYVIVHWQGTIPKPGHAGSVCLHAAIGKTDERGRFKVAGWSAAPKGYPVIQSEPTVMVYKPGFDQQPDYRDPGTPIVRTLARSKLVAERALRRSAGARATAAWVGSRPRYPSREGGRPAAGGAALADPRHSPSGATSDHARDTRSCPSVTGRVSHWRARARDVAQLRRVRTTSGYP